MSKAEGLTKDEHTIAEHRIKTADGLHELYVQEWGNPNGVPVLFLHGGPGDGCQDKHKKIFNHQRHRAIFIDQRGSGNSEPYGSLKNNETKYLVDDIELIRQKIGITNWHVIGGSWGSTLALTYAIKCSDKIKSLIILGVFLGSKEEINWLQKGLYRNFYPEVYDKQEIKDFRYDRKSDRLAYLKIFMPMLGIDDRDKELDKNIDTIPTKIELYYMNHECFMSKNYILNNAKNLNMPITIIQGRYDMITPPITAYKLSKALKDCRFHTVLTGHSSSDREASSMLKVVLNHLQ